MEGIESSLDTEPFSSARISRPCFEADKMGFRPECLMFPPYVAFYGTLHSAY